VELRKVGDELVVAAVAPQVLLERLKDYGKRARLRSGKCSMPDEWYFLIQDPLGCSGQDRMLALYVKSSYELKLLIKFWL
jgi:hypothetical protein